MPEPPVPDDDSLPEPPADSEDGPTVEAYEAENGVVLYDAENPLAWVKGDHARCIDDSR